MLLASASHLLHATTRMFGSLKSTLIHRLGRLPWPCSCYGCPIYRTSKGGFRACPSTADGRAPMEPFWDADHLFHYLDSKLWGGSGACLASGELYCRACPVCQAAWPLGVRWHPTCWPLSQYCSSRSHCAHSRCHWKGLRENQDVPFWCKVDMLSTSFGVENSELCELFAHAPLC